MYVDGTEGVRSHFQFMSLHNCETQQKKLFLKVGGCLWKICTSSCVELEGISTDCVVLLLLLYFRLTSFHLESVSVALLFSTEGSYQDGEFGWWSVGGGHASAVSPTTNPVWIPSWSRSHPSPQQQQMGSAAYLPNLLTHKACVLCGISLMIDALDALNSCFSHAPVFCSSNFHQQTRFNDTESSVAPA